MFHPYAHDPAACSTEPLDGYAGPTGCCIWSQEFYETDRARGFVRGYTFQFGRGVGPVSTALWGMATGGMPVGRRASRRVSRSCSTARAGMVAICEDLPEEHNTRDAGSRR